MKVIKRDGRIVEFNKSKITNAILMAAEHHRYPLAYKNIVKITDEISNSLKKNKMDNIEVELIQDSVVDYLKKNKHISLAKNYDEYRKERSKIRQNKLSVLKSIEKIGVETDRDNANVGNNFSAKLLRIASEANK
jgi:ribonucleoside-triphosphate reductase